MRVAGWDHSDDDALRLRLVRGRSARADVRGIESDTGEVVDGMAELRHLVVIDAPVTTVFRALTEQSGLAGWWTIETVAEPRVGSIAGFRFGDRYHNKMRIVRLDEGERVEWQCLEGDQEWVGTTFVFELDPAGDRTIVRFTHGNWRAATDFFASCNSHWGCYMRSLKMFCETGTGEPFGDGGT